jgi:hypothetical protein
MNEHLFFWSGVLIAAVPVLVFGALAGALVALYVRSQKQRSSDENAS